MNTIDGALYVALSANPGVAAFVGGSGAVPPSEPLITPVKNPQGMGALDELTFFIVSSESEVSVDGVKIGVAQTRIQISAWSKSVTTAKQIIAAVRIMTLGFIGQWDDVDVRVWGFATGPDMYEEDTKIYQIPCHLTLRHSEPTS